MSEMTQHRGDDFWASIVEEYESSSTTWRALAEKHGVNLYTLKGHRLRKSQARADRAPKKSAFVAVTTVPNHPTPASEKRGSIIALVCDNPADLAETLRLLR